MAPVGERKWALNRALNQNGQLVRAQGALQGRLGLKDLDSKYHHTPDDEIGPVKSALLSFGPVAGKHEGTVLGLGIGYFGELPAGFNDVCTFINRAQSCGILRGRRPRTSG